MLKISASDLEQLLTLVEEEINKGPGVRDRLQRRIACQSLNLPRKIIHEFITISEVLVRPSRTGLGKMIVVTGVDKSGKETQAFNPEKNGKVTSVYDYLLGRSHRVMKIALPSYCNTFGSLVAAYLGKEDSDVVILGELSEEVAWMLWSVDRAQHNPIIERWLSESPSNVVISKRWTETNIVYQKAKGIEPKRILMFERNITKPAYIFVIDVPLETVFKRMRASNEKPDKYETMEFLKKVRENYAKLREYFPFGNIFYFDGAGTLEVVNQRLLEKLDDLGF